MHEREGRLLPFVVDPDTGQESSPDLTALSGDLEADWYADAQALLVRREAQGRSTLHRVELELYAFNPRAQHVYARAGFRVEGRRRDAFVFDGERVDAIMMAVLRPEAESAVG